MIDHLLPVLFNDRLIKLSSSNFLSFIFERKNYLRIFFIVRIQDLEQLEKVFFFLVWIRMKLENEKKKKKGKACQEEFEQLWSESSINHGINHARPNNSNETIILDERLIGESSKIRGRSSENIRFSLFNSLPVPSQVQNRSAYLIQNASACLAFFFSSRKKTKTP